MVMTAEVAVIVPFYNAGRLIVKCIDSVKKQSGVNYSVLLISDGSRDGGLSLALEAFSADARFQILSQENAGVSAARNPALAQEDLGEFLLFLDADDELPPDALRSLLDAATPDADLVFGAYIPFKRFWRWSVDSEKVLWSATDYSLGGSEPLDSIRLGLSTPWAKLYRIPVVRTNNLRYMEGVPIGEDTRFNLEFCACSKGMMVHTPSVVCKYALGGMASWMRFHPAMFHHMADLCYVYGERRELFSAEFLEGMFRHYFEYSLIYVHCPPEEERALAREGIHYFQNVFKRLALSVNHLDKVQSFNLPSATDEIERYLFDWEIRNRKRIAVARTKYILKRRMGQVSSAV